MEIPSAASRRAYGLGRTLALSKFTSGISRSDARDGPRSFLPVAFFIPFPLMGRSTSRADDAERVRGFLQEDNQQNTSLLRLTDQDRALRVQCILQQRGKWGGEQRRGLYKLRLRPS